ncbi:MAG: carboxypeptidase-like regulatory domain-containing protein [Tannerella sp.]|jgi:hypothetical protein|nr:carboxypeptidase-like regulatory domain-containing protein [Tannerella sp.]
MTNTIMNGMKNARLKKLVNIMTLSAFLLITGLGTVSARGGDSQESSELQQSKARITGTVVDRTGEPVIGANVVEKGAAANGYAGGTYPFHRQRHSRQATPQGAVCQTVEHLKRRQRVEGSFESPSKEASRHSRKRFRGGLEKSKGTKVANIPFRQSEFPEYK